MNTKFMLILTTFLLFILFTSAIDSKVDVKDVSEIDIKAGENNILDASLEVQPTPVPKRTTKVLDSKGNPVEEGNSYKIIEETDFSSTASTTNKPGIGMVQINTTCPLNVALLPIPMSVSFRAPSPELSTDEGTVFVREDVGIKFTTDPKLGCKNSTLEWQVVNGTVLTGGSFETLALTSAKFQITEALPVVRTAKTVTLYVIEYCGKPDAHGQCMHLRKTVDSATKKTILVAERSAKNVMFLKFVKV